MSTNRPKRLASLKTQQNIQQFFKSIDSSTVESNKKSNDDAIESNKIQLSKK